jgi:hypothetical protein
MCQAADEIVELDEQKAEDNSVKPVPTAKIIDVALSNRSKGRHDSSNSK